MSSPCFTTIIGEKGHKRLKWVLDTLESGMRDINDQDDFESGVLSVGGEHIGWQGQWLLDNPRFISPDFFNSMKTGHVHRGDILLVKDGATIGKVAIADPPPTNRSAVNEHVFILRVRKDHYPKFYFYVIQSSMTQQQIQREIRGSAQPGLNAEFRNVVNVPVPSRPHQRAIVNYLDRETTRIDALIRAKEQLLRLLVEKRKALITHAVTRGLEPNVPIRDSGIPWLGEIPEHWEVERARWLFKERDERSQTGSEELLTVSHLTGVTLRSEKEVNMFEAETKEGYKLCYPGDLVINTLWAWMGAMGVARMNGMVSPAYHVYQPLDRLEPDYIDSLVRLPLFAQEVTRYSKGVWSSRLRLYPEGFFEVWLPVPPRIEQLEIVRTITVKTRLLDDLASAAKQAIDLLKERRTALITVAVTGQIDVDIAA